MSRIVDYQETTTPANNDVLLIETEDGTRKVKKSELLKAVQAMIAQPFDANKSGGYAVGDIVTYADKLYKFTSAHSGAWTGLDVEQVDVIDVIPFPNVIRIDLDSTMTYKTMINAITTSLQASGITDLDTIKDCKLILCTINTGTVQPGNYTYVYHLQSVSHHNLYLSNLSSGASQNTMSISINNLTISLTDSYIGANKGKIDFTTSGSSISNYQNNKDEIILNSQFTLGYVEFMWE